MDVHTPQPLTRRSRLIVAATVVTLTIPLAGLPSYTAVMAEPASTALASAPAAPAALTQEAATAELRTLFAKAVAECRATVERAAQQKDIADGQGREQGRKWQPSALPPAGQDPGGAARLSRLGPLEDLAERLNTQARLQMTPELRTYAIAAAGLLNDPDPANRGMACAFLGLLATHTAEAGKLPDVAAKLDDTHMAVKAFSERGVPQQQALAGEPAPEAASLTVGQLAQMALAQATNLRFDSPETFREWWKVNGDYESHLWYWALRWSRQENVENDLPHLFERDPKSALSLLILAASDNCLTNEAHDPWPDLHPAAGRQLPQTVHYVYFAPPPPASVATQVAKYHLRPQLLEMATGQFTWALPVPDYDREHLANIRVLPILAAASTPADVQEIRGLLQRAPGLVAKSAALQIGLTRLAAALDPDHADTLLREQLSSNPGLASLAADLVRRTGVRDWAMVKASYTHTSVADTDGAAALIAALATLKDAQARPRLAELLEAAPLDVLLNDDATPANPDSEHTTRFVAFVKAADALNGGKPVVDADTVSKAQAHIRFKISQDQMPAYAARNCAAVAARRQALADLLNFFRNTRPAAR